MSAILGLVGSMSVSASTSSPDRASGVLSVEDAVWMSDVFALTSKYPTKFGGVRFDADTGTFTVFTTESPGIAQSLLVRKAEEPALAAAH